MTEYNVKEFSGPVSSPGQAASSKERELRHWPLSALWTQRDTSALEEGEGAGKAAI